MQKELYVKLVQALYNGEEIEINHNSSWVSVNSIKMDPLLYRVKPKSKHPHQRFLHLWLLGFTIEEFCPVSEKYKEKAYPSFSPDLVYRVSKKYALSDIMNEWANDPSKELQIKVYTDCYGKRSFYWETTETPDFTIGVEYRINPKTVVYIFKFNEGSFTQEVYDGRELQKNEFLLEVAPEERPSGPPQEFYFRKL